MNHTHNRFSILLPISLFIAIGFTTMPNSKSPSPHLQDQKDECEKKHPWQHKVNGQCVDKPGVCRNCGQPEGYECWVECLCREGEYPANESCAPCSRVGTVCAPN